MNSTFEKYSMAMWSDQNKLKHYKILGYDKDADVYVRLVNVHMPLDVAISIANHVASLSPKRRSNGEPFDWLEVVTELEGIQHHVVQCK